MIKAIFFDLDGTLLPFDENHFVEVYFNLLCKKAAPFGYEPKQLTKVIWEGTKKMMANNGKQSNKEAFWNYFIEVYGEEKRKDIPIFDDFYTNEFKQVKSIMKPNPDAKKIIDTCHELGFDCILSTNPIFPLAGTLTRMAFVDLFEKDFKFITAYENSSYSKPNPMYFINLLDKLNLKSDEVVLFGNNEYEDGEAASAAGIKVYMVGDYIIKHPTKEMNLEHLSISEVIDKIKSFKE